MLSLLRFLGSEPEALVDHATAYVDLAGQELHAIGRQWSRRAAWAAIAVVSAGSALLLGGVAAMLWAVIPALDAGAARAWVLIAVPVVPALLAGVAGAMALGVESDPPLAELKAQWREDVGLFRSALREEFA